MPGDPLDMLMQREKDAAFFLDDIMDHYKVVSSFLLLQLPHLVVIQSPVLQSCVRGEVAAFHPFVLHTSFLTRAALLVDGD